MKAAHDKVKADYDGHMKICQHSKVKVYEEEAAKWKTAYEKAKPFEEEATKWKAAYEKAKPFEEEATKWRVEYDKVKAEYDEHMANCKSVDADSWRKKHDALLAELEVARGKAAKATGELDALNASFTNISANFDILKNNFADAEKGKSDWEVQAADWKAKYNQLAKERIQEEAKMKEWQGKYDELKKEYNVYIVNYNKLEASNKDLLTKLEVAEKEAKTAKEWEAKYNELLAKFNSLQTDNNALNAKFTSLDRDWDGKYAILLGRFNGLEKDNNALNNKLSSNNADWEKKYNTLNNDWDKKYNDLLAKLKGLEKDNSSLQVALEECRNKPKGDPEAEAKYNKLFLQFEGLNKDNANLQSEIEALKRAGANQIDEDKYNQLLVKFEGLNNRYTSLEKDKLGLRGALEEANKRLALASQNAVLLTQFQQRYETSNKERNDFASRIPSLEVEILRLKALLAQKPAEAPKPKKKGKETKEEVLARIRQKAQNIDFNRIGRFTADQQDDLKEISGIGPFIEEKLHALGIYRFEQVSRFTREDIDKINDAIEFFPGRILRDDWVGQAAELAKKN